MATKSIFHLIMTQAIILLVKKLSKKKLAKKSQIVLLQS